MTTERAVLLANAGSGKTFRLANSVIRWCIDEMRAGREPAPSRILAVTFTRKAAGEILARILVHAAQGAAPGEAGDRARREFRDVVGDAGADEYQRVLEALCRELHAMQVGTLDGFFHRVATAMPADAGLPAEWTIGETGELAELRAHAAARVLEDDRALELLELLEEGAPKPSVISAIGGLLGGRAVTVLDHYRATEWRGAAATARAWEWAKRLLNAESSRGGSDRFDRIIDEFEREPLPLTGKGKPHANWVKAHRASVDACRARRFDDLSEDNLLWALANDEPYYSLPPSPRLHELAREIAGFVRFEMLSRVARRLDGALSVLPIASRALREAQDESGLLDFGDVGRAVAQAATREGSRLADPDAIVAGLGAEIRDLALDEAQDTSVAQFLALRPLVEKILGRRGAHGAGRFLLVGDPKQSIYGWRGGVPGLIAHIQREYAAELGSTEPLSKSYRSSPIVMDFVNRVFGRLENDLLPLVEARHNDDLVGISGFLASEAIDPGASGSAFKRALAEWRFIPHQASASRKGGAIHAYACGAMPPAAPGAAADELGAAACGAAIAARIHAERPHRTIAVLARSNKELADAVAELKALGVAASDEGRSSLLDSPAVAAVVAVLRIVDTPGDRISHFIVSHGAMSAVTGLAPLESHASTDDAAAAAAAFASRARAEIADRGLARYIRGISRALDAHALGARDRARLARVVAIAEEFGDEPPARLTDFIDAVEDDESDAGSSHKVRVMTVHAAKGLEFDEVVLIGLDGKWGETPKGWGVVSIDPTEPPVMVAPLASENLRRWVPEIGAAERDERRRRLLDDLSGLYVAITRAKHAVHLVMDVKQSPTLPTGARLILAAVDGAAGAADHIEPAGSISAAFAGAAPSSDAPFWSAEYEGDPEPPAPARAAVERGSQPTTGAAAAPLVEIVAAAGGAAAPPSSHEHHSLWRFEPFGQDHEVALRGVLVHECFREVVSIDAIDSDPKRRQLAVRAARRASVEKGVPIAADMVDAAAELLARCATGPIGAALASEPNSNAREVRTEVPFVRETADGLVHGRIDRLELVRDGAGRVSGAVIVDYKTGASGEGGESFAAKTATYFGQLEGYRSAVSCLYGIDEASITLRLLFVDRGEVVERPQRG